MLHTYKYEETLTKHEPNSHFYHLPDQKKHVNNVSVKLFQKVFEVGDRHSSPPKNKPG